MTIKFSTAAWEDYLYWQTNDKAMLKRINMLIRDIQRQPFVGIGKPEPLKHDALAKSPSQFSKSDFWENRLPNFAYSWRSPLTEG